MIITRQKPMEEILEMLKDAQTVYLVGCGDCATVCQTGGEFEVNEMTERLTAAGKTVTGSVIPDAGCIELDVARAFRKDKEALSKADAVLVMSCGAGTQSAAAAVDKPVYPSNDTVFLGNVQRQMQFQQKCSMCGECIVHNYGTVCPLTYCPKGQINGPCGGTSEGKCEVDNDKDCVWTLIFERMEKLGVEPREALAQVEPPRDYGKEPFPRRLVGEARRASKA